MRADAIGYGVTLGGRHPCGRIGSGGDIMADQCCVFCRIARGEAGAFIVAEDELTVGFLDSHPIRPGHVQIVPRRHHPCFEDLPAETAARIVHVGQRLARAMKEIYRVPRVAFLFTGSDVPHAHAHVVPMHEKTDITSRLYIREVGLTFRSTPAAAPDELAAVAARLWASLSTAGPA